MINWKLRYARILHRHPALDDPARTVLEVGAGGSGVRNYLSRPVVSVDLAQAHARSAGSFGVRADATALPFANGAFDFVLCLDTLEHIPVAARTLAIRELDRVSRGKLIIGLPMGRFAIWGDKHYAQSLQQRGQAVPSWLAEHLHLGMPALADVLNAIAALGHHFRVDGNETLIQHYAGLLADDVPFLRQANTALQSKNAPAPPVGSGDGDVYYSYLIEVDTTISSVQALPMPVPPEHPAVQSTFPIDLYCVAHKAAQALPHAVCRHFFTGQVRPETWPDEVPLTLDDAPQSIKELNPRYSELTAIYSVWKNRRHRGLVGFCHYRRLFDFSASGNTRRAILLNSRSDLEQAGGAIGNIEHYRRFLAQGGVIVPLPDSSELSVAEHYMANHYSDHYLAAINYVLARYPQMAAQVVRQFGSNSAYFNNMFVCSAPFFDEMCSWWFDTLFAIDAQLETPRDAYQRRMMSFLAERLLDIYLRWRFANGTPHLELPIFTLSDGVF